MTSVLSSFKQPSKATLNTGGYSPVLFQLSDIQAAFSTATVVGNIYLSPDATSFGASADALNTSTVPLGNGSLMTLIDLGKDLYIGVNGGENDLLHFRLVKATGDVNSIGEPVGTVTGYTVIDNKLGLSYHNLSLIHI